MKKLKKLSISLCSLLCVFCMLIGMGLPFETRVAATGTVNITGFRYCRAIYMNKTTPRLDNVNFFVDQDLTGLSGEIDVIVNGKTHTVSVTYAKVDSETYGYINFLLDVPEDWTPIAGDDDYASDPEVIFDMIIPAGTVLGSYTLAEQAYYRITKPVGLTDTATHPRQYCTAVKLEQINVSDITRARTIINTGMDEGKQKYLDFDITLSEAISGNQNVEIIVNGQKATALFTLSGTTATVHVYEPEGWNEDASTVFYVEIPSGTCIGDYVVDATAKYIITQPGALEVVDWSSYKQITCTYETASDPTIEFTWDGAAAGETVTTVVGTSASLLTATPAGAIITWSEGAVDTDGNLTVGTHTATATYTDEFGEEFTKSITVVAEVPDPVTLTFDKSIGKTRVILMHTNESEKQKRFDLFLTSNIDLGTANFTTDNILINGEKTTADVVVNGTSITIYAYNPKGWSETTSSGFHVVIPQGFTFPNGSMTEVNTEVVVMQKDVMSQPTTYLQSYCTLVDAAETTIASLYWQRTILIDTVKTLTIQVHTATAATAGGDLYAKVMVNGVEAFAKITTTSGETLTTLNIENPEGWNQDGATTFCVTIPEEIVFPDGRVLSNTTKWIITQPGAMAQVGSYIRNESCTGVAATAPTLGFTWNGAEATEVNVEEGASASLLTATPAGAIITWSEGAVDTDGNLTAGTHTATATYTDGFGDTYTKTITVKVTEPTVKYNSMDSMSWAGHNVASGILYNQFVPSVSYTGTPTSVTVDVYVNGVKTTSAINSDDGKWQFAISVPNIEAANGNAYHVVIPAGTVFPDGSILANEERWLSVCNNASGNGYVKVQLTQADTQIAPTYCVDGSGTKLQMVFTNPVVASVYNSQSINVTVKINGESVTGVISDNGDGSGVTFIFDGYEQSATSSTLDIVIPAGTAFYNGTYLAEDYKVRLTPGSDRYTITINPAATDIAFNWNGEAVTSVSAIEGDLASLLTTTPTGATITWSDGAVVDGKLTTGTHKATATYTDGFGQTSTAEITVEVVGKNYVDVTECYWIGHDASENYVYISLAIDASYAWRASKTATVIVNGVECTAEMVADGDATVGQRWQFKISVASVDRSVGTVLDITIPEDTVLPDGTLLRELRYIGTNKEASGQGNYTVQYIEKPTLTLEWTGGELTAGADASQLVATLTGSTVQDGDVAVITWSDGAVVGGKLQEGTHTVTATYTDAYDQTVTETLTVEVQWGVASFMMEIGAYIRASGNGMKFQASMSAEDYEALIAKGAEFGMIIVPRDYVVSGYELTVANLFGANAKYSTDGTAGKKMILLDNLTPKASNGNYVIEGGIYDLIVSNLTREFVGLAYVKIGEEYVLASFADENIDNSARSMYYVAQRAIDAGHELSETVNTKYIEEFTNYLTENNYTYQVTYTVKYIYQSYTSVEVVEYTSKDYLNSSVTVTADGAKEGFVLASSESLTQKLYANKENVFEFVYTVEDFVGIDVSAWVMSPLNGADDDEIAAFADELKAAGITTANLIWAGAYADTTAGVERFETLINGLYAKGIKSVVCFHNSGETESEVYTSIPDFSSCDGFVGILVWDEPTYDTISRVAEYADMFEKVYAGTDAVFMVNLLPSYADSTKLGGDFEAYIDTFCSTVLTKVSGEKWLSLDTYPIYKDGTLGDTFLYDLAILKAYAEKYNATAHVVLQSSGWNEGSDSKSVAPTEAQMNFQAYTALAMGVDSYSWFSYGPVNATNLAGQSPSESTTIYNSLKNTNAEIAKFGGLYTNYDWKGSIINKGSYTIFSGEANNEKKALATVLNTDAFDAYSLSASDTDFSSISSKQNFVMGVMENDEGKNAYVIANYSSATSNKTATVTLTTSEAKTFAIYTNGDVEVVTINGSYTLTLAVGEGAFIVEQE